MKERDYHHLLGKPKFQIKKELGSEFNFYQSNLWTYLLKIGWFGMRKILMIEFQDDKVNKIKIKNVYSRKTPSKL